MIEIIIHGIDDIVNTDDNIEEVKNKFKF